MEFWKIQGDALARALRNKFKKQKTFPKRKFLCVYSEETPLKNKGENASCGTSQCMCPKARLISGLRGTDSAVYDAPGDQRLVEHEWCTSIFALYCQKNEDFAKKSPFYFVICYFIAIFAAFNVNVCTICHPVH